MKSPWRCPAAAGDRRVWGSTGDEKAEHGRLPGESDHGGPPC